MIKVIESKCFGGNLAVEFYASAQQVVEDLKTRPITDERFHKNPYSDPDWVGADRADTYRFLKEGYQPVVDTLKETKITASGQSKRFQTYQDVAGFQPIIPNAIMGLPNAMINSRMRPIKTKVLNVYYEMTVTAGYGADELLDAGKKLLGVIIEMEAQGYRFNLYCTQGYYSRNKGMDMLCVKVKSANQPLDLKRMSFPLTHPAFFRGVGFDWYSKFPKGTFRPAYGTSITVDRTQAEIQAEYERIFGKGAVYFSAMTLIRKSDNAESYIREVLTK